jgi:dihydrofolate reductase
MKVILYIAMSLDGYIAKKNDDISFLSSVDRPGEDYGHAHFMESIDSVVWGRRTFEKVLSFSNELPYADKNIFVVTSRKLKNFDNVTYVSDPIQWIEKKQLTNGKNIYCDGGAELIFSLLSHKKIDQMVINIIPHLLGDGIKLFKEGAPELKLKLDKTITFESGLVQLWYDVIKD